MKTIKDLTEKMNQVKGSVVFSTGYADSDIYLYDFTGDNVYRFHCDKSFSSHTLQEIEADLIAQVNESEIVEKMLYENKKS